MFGGARDLIIRRKGFSSLLLILVKLYKSNNNGRLCLKCVVENERKVSGYKLKLGI